MIEALLREKKIGVTKQRKLILSVLVDNRKPMTIDEISQKISGSIDLSTIYRSLDVFVKKGLVYQTDFQKGVAYFEYQDAHHHHISCIRCGKHDEINLCFEDTFPQIQKNTGYTISHHMLELFGICNDCSHT